MDDDTKCMAADADVVDWLERFARHVRERDFDRGSTMFHRDVIGYGTWTPTAVGLDALIDEQWRPVWQRTTGFRFDTETASVIRHDGADGTELRVVTSRWASCGEPTNGHAEPFERRGRATIVLRRDTPDAPLLALHTHFSLDPNATLDGRPAESAQDE